MIEPITDYERYRGKCKEISEALVVVDQTLRLARGYYYDYQWGKQRGRLGTRPSLADRIVLRAHQNGQPTRLIDDTRSTVCTARRPKAETYRHYAKHH